MPQLIKAQAHQLHALTPSILQVFLKPQTFIPYEAGQYLEIRFLNEAPLYYSIANAPITQQFYELHIRHDATMPLIPALYRKDMLSLYLPLGECTTSKLASDKSLILFAGGTGYAPMKAIIEQLHHTNIKRQITLFWAAKTNNELYMHHQMQELSQQHPSFQYFPCITSQFSLKQTLKTHLPILALDHAEIVLAGPFEMVYALRDELLAYGVNIDQMHADAFAFTL